MPGSGIILLLTIVATNVDNAAQFRRNRLESDPCGHSIPSGHHSFSSLGCLLADGATGIMCSQLSEAFPMNRMTTWHFMRGTSGTKQEFLTYWTIGFVFSTFTIVIGVETSVNAHSTVMTVLKILRPSYSAESTIRAVIGPLVVVHPEIANITVVFSKLNSALDAIVSVLKSIGIGKNRNEAKVRITSKRGDWKK